MMTDTVAGVSHHKIQALLWKELSPGNYWVYPVGDPAACHGTDSQFATVIIWQNGLWITYGDRLEPVGEAWDKYQFVPCRRPPLEYVQFHGVSKIEPMRVNDDVLMSGVFTVTNDQKEWLARTQSVVASQAQPLIKSFLYRIETQAGEPLSKWRSLEALAITEAMANVMQKSLN